MGEEEEEEKTESIVFTWPTLFCLTRIERVLKVFFFLLFKSLDVFTDNFVFVLLFFLQ